MTIRLVPAVVYDSRLRFLNLHHLPHINSSLSAAEFLFEEGLLTGSLLYNMLNIVLYGNQFFDSKTFAAQFCTVKTIRRLQ